MDPSPKTMAAQQALAAIQNISEGLIIVDRDNRITFMNPAAELMTGWSLQEALGLPSGLVFRIINAITREPDWQPVRPSMEDDRPYLLLPNSLLVRRDGHGLPVEDTVSPMHDDMGNVIGAVILFRDVGNTRETLLRVLERVHRDPLTNLPNRAFFGEFLTTRQAPGTQFALLYLDLDRFKQINDTWGHLAGDFTLQVFAHRLRKTLPETAVLCRWGGDEFIVLLQDTESVREVHSLVDSLHEAFAEDITWEGSQIKATASVGIAMGNDANKGDLLAIADRAMYRAKRASKTPSTQRPSATEVLDKLQDEEIHALLRLEEQQLLLYYQPVFDLVSHTIIGAEALLRCQLPEKQIALPEEFIANAERNGSIIPVGRAILRQALRQLRSWQSTRLANATVAVNVSATELLDPDYLLNLDRMLAEERYAGQGLILEVTESVLLQPLAHIDIVRELRERQLRVAIDDFGMGYSNLNQLRRSPFDIIKLDRDFLKQVPESTQDMKLVTAMVDMAHSLDRLVIAEGVETPAQQEFLLGIACDQAQGFLFSPPISAAEFTALFEASTKPNGSA